MRLERLIVENYKAFRRAEVSVHPQVTVLIGTNASGKTSLMEVLDLLNGIVQNSQPDWLRRLFLARSRDGFVGCFPWMDTSRPMAFEIHAALEDRTLHYRLALETDPEGRPQVVEERLWDDDQEWAVLDGSRWRIPSAGLDLAVGTTYPPTLSQRGEWTFQEHRLDIPLRFVRWVGQWFILRPYTLEAGRAWDQLDIARQTRLSRRGENFAPVLFYWKNSPDLRSRWEWVFDRTRMLLEHLGLGDVVWDVIPKPEQERALVQVRIWPKDAKPWQGYDLAFGPDGLRQWLIVLTALCEPMATLIAVEEPETHLDLRMLDLLAEALQSAVYSFDAPIGRQVLLTTHSPVLAGEWPPEHVRLIQRGTVQALPDFLARALREERIRLLEAWLLDMLTEVSQE